jgi:hypothetical protein
VGKKKREREKELISDTPVSWHLTTQLCYPTQPSLKTGKPPRTLLPSQPPTLVTLPPLSQLLPPVLVLVQVQLFRLPQTHLPLLDLLLLGMVLVVSLSFGIGIELMYRSSWNFGWGCSIGWIRWGCLLVVLNVRVGGLESQCMDSDDECNICLYLACLIHLFVFCSLVLHTSDRVCSYRLMLKMMTICEHLINCNYR